MKVAFLTSGGIAPCLSSSIARLIYNYSKLDKDIEFIGYLYGYKGLLTDKKILIPSEVGERINSIYDFGGTFLANTVQNNGGYGIYAGLGEVFASNNGSNSVVTNSFFLTISNLSSCVIPSLK